MSARRPDTAVAGHGELPHPGRYEIDPVHSVVGFVARHLVVTKVRGRFPDVTGTLVVADPIERSHVAVSIRADSVVTGVAARDEHLRSPAFFDVEAHPLVTFRSTAVTARGDGSGVVEGDLTVRGTTRTVALDVTSLGSRPQPDGRRAIVLHAMTRVQREDFGLMWDEVAPTGGILIGHAVDIELHVQAVPVT